MFSMNSIIIMRSVRVCVGLVICASLVWVGGTTKVEASGHDDQALAELYEDVTQVREQAITSNAGASNEELFMSAEDNYSQGQALYQNDDASASEMLSTALAQYKELIDLERGGALELRNLAEREYEQAAAAFEQLSADIANLEDTLRKENIVPSGGAVNLDRLRAGKELQVGDHDETR